MLKGSDTKNPTAQPEEDQGGTLLAGLADPIGVGDTVRAYASVRRVSAPQIGSPRRSVVVVICGWRVRAFR